MQAYKAHKQEGSHDSSNDTGKQGQGGDIGGQGGLGPSLFIQGGRAPPNYLTTALNKVPKLPYLARNLHCKNRSNFQAQLIKQTRGFAFVF